MTKDELARFMTKVNMRGPVVRSDIGACWLWTAFTHKGYGRFRTGGKMERAHRVAYEHWHGPVPSGLWVLHACDVPTCVNPAHLSAGTPKDNGADVVARGRRTRVLRNGEWQRVDTDPERFVGAVSWLSEALRMADLAISVERCGDDAMLLDAIYHALDRMVLRLSERERSLLAKSMGADDLRPSA